MHGGPCSAACGRGASSAPPATGPRSACDRVSFTFHPSDWILAAAGSNSSAAATTATIGTPGFKAALSTGIVSDPSFPVGASSARLLIATNNLALLFAASACCTVVLHDAVPHLTSVAAQSTPWNYMSRRTVSSWPWRSKRTATRRSQEASPTPPPQVYSMFNRTN